MKRYISIFLLCLAASLSYAQDGKVTRCSEEDVPDSQRPLYIKFAHEMLDAYYGELPLIVNDLMVQEVFKKNYMLAEQTNYMPEFVPDLNIVMDFLTPDMYMFELDKTFATVDTDMMQFEIENFQVDTRDFFNYGRTGLRLIATYDLVLEQSGKRIFTRPCEANCLFPLAKVFIDVKLMQVRPLSGNSFRIVDEKELAIQNTENPIKENGKVKEAGTDDTLKKKFLNYCTESGLTGQWMIGLTVAFFIVPFVIFFFTCNDGTPLSRRLVKILGVCLLFPTAFHLFLLLGQFLNVDRRLKDLGEAYPSWDLWAGLFIGLGGGGWSLYHIYSSRKKGKSVDFEEYLMSVMFVLITIVCILRLVFGQ